VTTAYRDSAPRCPACNLEMEARQAGDAVVDLCPACHGLWVDWFDGDTLVVLRDAQPISAREPVRLPRGAPCPRCALPLAPEAHGGCSRCGECAGTFVPRAVVDDLLAWAERQPETAPAPPDDANAPSSVLARFVAAVRALFAR